MTQQQVAVYLIGTDAETECIACHFTVERLVDALHANRLVFCWPHAQAAAAHGDAITRPVELLAAARDGGVH